ncbi:hypothetical protein [Thermocoleostomius sinensis]|uniref:Uncharacterized protein n=1 Tax=Thermocoleostomius sinensis A174 TaxID=2016057 RepID=A0A9E8ZEC8_9CYAN|nr:hypothetical protein [Thermocoleostomius sinensis]WAL59640.1 hypothetical protein OXH18_21090 [Thermocoleostomius sinensis A174]
MMKPMIVPIVFSALLGLPVLLGSATPSIAHQQMSATESVEAMVHLEPNDTPQAGTPSLTWVMLMNPDGSEIAPSSCACRLAIYDASDRRIAHHISLEERSVDGQMMLATSLTFPDPGTYTLVLTAEPSDGSFEAFELKFPVTVTP